jgi:gamma-glutamyltranspeptidase/glutathione hydrolase
MLDLGMPPEQAIAQPRIHHQWSPDELAIEKSMPSDLRAALVARGHKLNEHSTMGVSQIVARSADSKRFVGTADPRASGTAEGL